MGCTFCNLLNQEPKLSEPEKQVYIAEIINDIVANHPEIIAKILKRIALEIELGVGKIENPYYRPRKHRTKTSKKPA